MKKAKKSRTVVVIVFLLAVIGATILFFRSAEQNVSKNQVSLEGQFQQLRIKK
jgi:uncharacterized protein YpmB